MTGSLLLLGGYSAATAIIFYVYLVNVCHITPAGLVLTSISITHFSYMFSLLSCLTVTNLRLIRRFRDAEQLSQALAETNRTLDKKVEKDPSHPRFLRNIAGKGYIFSVDGEG